MDSLPASAPPLPQNPAQGSILGLFTGGSTGSPRIWSKTAENLLGEGFFIAAHYGIGAGDRILATVPVCHIYGLLYGVVLPLVSGTSVCAHTPIFPEEMAKAVEATTATVFISVPAHYHALAASDKRLAPCALRLAFSSAGMLDERDALAFAQANRLGIIEVFGSTETPGHMGNERVTVNNLTVAYLDPERNLIGVKGAIPGARGGLVMIKGARKS